MSSYDFCFGFLINCLIIPCLPKYKITWVECIHKTEDIVTLLLLCDSPITLVFRPRAPIPNSKGNFFGRDAKYTGGGLPSLSETVRDRPMITTER